MPNVSVITLENPHSTYNYYYYRTYFGDTTFGRQFAGSFATRSVTRQKVSFTVQNFSLTLR